MVNLMTDSFDVWTTAQAPKTNGNGNGNGSAYGIKKLRELILELAVRGKLIPQYPSDEPASALLQKIAKEKARLGKEGKIKKEKPLPEIAENERPFELPKGWEWTRLANLSADIHYGFTASANQTTQDVRLLRITDIQRDSVNWESVPGCDIEKDKIADYQLEDGDIVIARTGGTIGKSYMVDDINLVAVFASYLIRVRRIDGMYPSYIKTFLGSQLYWNQLLANSMGTGQPNVNGNALKRLAFPLPPLAEQRRIVAKVDELTALCDQLEQQQTDNSAAHQTLVETLLCALTAAGNSAKSTEAWQLIGEHFDTLFTTEQSIDQLKQTILQLAVMGKLAPQDPNDEPAGVLLQKIAQEEGRLIKEGRIRKRESFTQISEGEIPFELPKGWKWIRFNQLINPEYPISYGVLVPGPDIENGVPFARVGDLDLKNPPIRPEKSIDRGIDEKYERTRILGGEILMGVVGSIGKLGVAPDSWRGANIARAICRLVPTQMVSKDYVIRLLQSDLMQTGFVGDTRTLAQPTLNVGLIKEAITPLPPFAEQHRIVAKVDELMTLCDTLKARLKDAQATQVHLADAIVEQAIRL